MSKFTDVELVHLNKTDTRTLAQKWHNSQDNEYKKLLEDIIIQRINTTASSSFDIVDLLIHVTMPFSEQALVSYFKQYAIDIKTIISILSNPKIEPIIQTSLINQSIREIFQFESADEFLLTFRSILDNSTDIHYQPMLRQFISALCKANASFLNHPLFYKLPESPVHNTPLYVVSSLLSYMIPMDNEPRSAINNHLNINEEHFKHLIFQKLHVTISSTPYKQLPNTLIEVKSFLKSLSNVQDNDFKLRCIEILFNRLNNMLPPHIVGFDQTKITLSQNFDLTWGLYQCILEYMDPLFLTDPRPIRKNILQKIHVQISSSFRDIHQAVILLYVSTKITNPLDKTVFIESCKKAILSSHYTNDSLYYMHQYAMTFNIDDIANLTKELLTKCAQEQNNKTITEINNQLKEIDSKPAFAQRISDYESIIELAKKLPSNEPLKEIFAHIQTKIDDEYHKDETQKAHAISMMNLDVGLLEKLLATISSITLKVAIIIEKSKAFTTKKDLLKLKSILTNIAWTPSVPSAIQLEFWLQVSKSTLIDYLPEKFIMIKLKELDINIRKSNLISVKQDPSIATNFKMCFEISLKTSTDVHAQFIREVRTLRLLNDTQKLTLYMNYLCYFCNSFDKENLDPVEQTQIKEVVKPALTGALQIACKPEHHEHINRILGLIKLNHDNIQTVIKSLLSASKDESEKLHLVTNIRDMFLKYQDHTEQMVPWRFILSSLQSEIKNPNNQEKIFHQLFPSINEDLIYLKDIYTIEAMKPFDQTATNDDRALGQLIAINAKKTLNVDDMDIEAIMNGMKELMYTQYTSANKNYNPGLFNDGLSKAMAAADAPKASVFSTTGMLQNNNAAPCAGRPLEPLVLLSISTPNQLRTTQITPRQL